MNAIEAAGHASTATNFAAVMLAVFFLLGAGGCYLEVRRACRVGLNRVSLRTTYWHWWRR